MTRQETIDQFSRLFYDSWLQTWASTTWFGIPTEKPANDLWIYQEIISELRPDFIVETGTRYGGSALYLATVCEALGRGHIITIDVQALASGDRVRPAHPRVTYLTGSSTSPEIVAQVSEMIGASDTVMVILDSDHSMSHVSDELRLYAQFVTESSYLIVEDTEINGHPVLPDFGPGPWEAVEVFLASAPEFVPDRSREKFLLTFNPRGYLKRHAVDSEGGRLRAAEAELASDRETVEELRSLLTQAQDETHAALRQVEELRSELDVWRQGAEEQRQRVDEAIAAAQEAAREHERWVKEGVAASESQRAAVESQLATVESQLTAVAGSASWRLTAPLRQVSAMLSRKPR